MVFESTGSDAYDEGSAPGEFWEIDTGWNVFGADGEKLGSVQDVQSRYIVVAKGFFFPEERYVPVEAITRVENEQVYLNVTRADIDARGWNVAPDATDTPVAADTVDASVYRDEHEHRDDRRASVVDDEPRRDALGAERSEPQDAHLHGHPGETYAGMDHMPVDAPLRIEEIRVERHAVAREYGDNDVPSDAFQETTYVIPIRGEEATVTKRPVVRERVDISKQVRERRA